MGVLYQILSNLRVLYDLVIDFIFALCVKSERIRLPPITNELVLESACSLAGKIRNRQLKAEEVVEAFVERSKQVNPLINAIVDERYVRALKEARKIDEDIKNGRISQEEFKRKPFLGIPFTTKESTACKGLRWTLGLVVRKNIVADEDATVVQLMKEAGAILIAVTNVPQLNFWTESYNPIHGTCRNPYDLRRNVGGSSGGEGSIISACGSPIGIGTDIGGSIRIPSHRCGIFGHKSSPDLVHTKGLSFSKGDVSVLTVAGPMAKHSEDLIPFYKILLGSNVNKLKLDERVDLKRLNVFYMTSIKCVRNSRIQKQMQLNVLKVVKHFEDISGRRPVEVDFEDTKYATDLWSYKIQLEKIDFNYNLKNRQGRVNVPLEYLKYLLGKREYTAYTLYNMINGLLPSVNFEWAKETLKNLKESIKATLGDNGVLIFPSEARPADFNYVSLFRCRFSYFCLWNALEMPVTQVPLGLNGDGLPIGVQIVAAPFQDHLSLAVACELDRVFGGYAQPSYNDV